MNTHIQTTAFASHMSQIGSCLWLCFDNRSQSCACTPNDDRLSVQQVTKPYGVVLNPYYRQIVRVTYAFRARSRFMNQQNSMIFFKTIETSPRTMRTTGHFDAFCISHLVSSTNQNSKVNVSCYSEHAITQPRTNTRTNTFTFRTATPTHTPAHYDSIEQWNDRVITTHSYYYYYWLPTARACVDIAHTNTRTESVYRTFDGQ